jgi:hypothetical protein
MRSLSKRSSSFLMQMRSVAAIPLVYFILSSSYASAQSSTLGDWVWLNGSNQSNQNASRGTVQVPSATNNPGSRAGMASWIDNSGNLWTYGGIDAAGNAYTDVWEFNATTLEWVWMAGPSTPNLAGVYGTQGTPSASNFPGLRSGTGTWKDLD